MPKEEKTLREELSKEIDEIVMHPQASIQGYKDEIIAIFEKWALGTIMLSHSDNCALYKGEQTDSCDCTPDDIISTFIENVKESVKPRKS